MLCFHVMYLIGDGAHDSCDNIFSRSFQAKPFGGDLELYTNSLPKICRTFKSLGVDVMPGSLILPSGQTSRWHNTMKMNRQPTNQVTAESTQRELHPHIRSIFIDLILHLEFFFGSTESPKKNSTFFLIGGLKNI